MKHIDLETFASGSFTAQVNRAIEEVTENIQNPNTDATAARKIVVTIGFKPERSQHSAWARIFRPEKSMLWRSVIRSRGRWLYQISRE